MVIGSVDQESVLIGADGSVSYDLGHHRRAHVLDCPDWLPVEIINGESGI